MVEQRSRSFRTLTASLIYLVAIAGALAIASLRSRAKAGPETENTYEEPVRRTDPANTKPFFSLSTNRTYGSRDNPRLWVDYQGVDHLDFRVYQVKDPRKFFTQLKDPHQMGEDEEEEVTQSLPRKKSFLERVRTVKRWAYSGVKEFVRAQLKRDSRQAFNQKFRKEEETVRTPLNVADYARVPLLNPDSIVTTWREPLQPLEDEYDKRMIPLGKRSPGVYLVEAVANDLRAYTIVVVTDLTMIDKTTRDGDLMIYAVDRKTGEPRAGAEIEIVREKQTITSGKTDDQGIFKTKIPTSKASTTEATEGDEEGGDEGDVAAEEENPAANSLLIFARHSGNFAISDHGALYMDGSEEESQEIKSYIYTDRPIYRPNHKVSFKGIVRAVDANGAYKPVEGNTVTVTIEDPNSAQIFNQEISLTSRGTFAGDVEISEEAPLGSYNIVADIGGVRSNGSFEVAEYKKPEYKVTVSAPGKFVQTGQKANFSIDAKYFFGAPVANAEVKYYIYRSRYYAWGYGEDDDTDVTGEDSDDEDEYADYYGYGDDMVQESEGNLDARGHLNVEFEVPQTDEKDTSDYSYRLEAQVTDSARRTIDGAGSFVATRGTIIADANPERYVYTKGDVAKVRVNTRDYEGRPVSANVQLQFVERTWTKKEKKENDDEYSYPEYDMHERVIGSGNVQTDAQGQASFDYTTTEDGNISIKTVIDEGGKKVASIGGYLWVTDRQAAWSESSYYSQDHNSIKLVPDKKTYKPGETAHVLAILPTDQAHLLVSTELTNVMSLQHVSSPGRTIILDVPIVANYAPNVFLNVAYVKNGNMHSSDQRIVVPARDKMLNLEIISNKNEYKPRETASYTILARNADGAPVSGAEVSLGIVDESIYSVAQDYSGNIKTEFYGMRYNSVDTQLSISYHFIGYAGDKPMELARNKPTYQLADFKNESNLVQPTIRKNFKDTAFWQPDVVTGADGKATVKVELPDNLTTWRATARGVTADTKVGATKYKVLARKDVIMRLETPRFITQGDTVTLSGIVHNYLNADKSTQISLEVSGAQLQGGSPQQTVNVRKNGEQRIDWQVSAPNVGEIKLLAKALTDTESDAVELPIMVVPRGLHQVKNESWTFAEETADKTISIAIPNDSDPRARTLRIEVAPSVAGALFGALDYLTTYPYGCTEQTMSSFLPNVIVSQALKEVQTSTIRNPQDLDKKVRKGLDRLYAYQHEDGGWGWWKDDQSDPFMTAYVVSGLTWAKAGGFNVADDRIGNGREKLKQMLDAGKTEAGTAIDLETRAFMVYALEESGDAEGKHVESIYGERGNLQPYGRALLALTLKGRKDDKRARDVAAEIERTATSDNFYASWESTRKAMLDFAEQNDTEATALSLKALATIKPDSGLLPKVARWLVSNRRNSHYWSSTKDTAFAIFGLIDYLKVSKELSPNYEVEVYLNGENVLTERVTSPSKSFSIIRKAGDVAGNNDIRIVKRGAGLTYFAASIDYYSGEEDVAARGSGDLNITREYLRLKVVEDGYKLKWQTEPLRGEIRSGDILVVKLKVNGAKARHLMIEDPIPAGAEQVESVGNLDLDYSTGHDWSDWYSSREFRDNRTVYFLDYFDGDSTFQYAMRVQVPGQFRVAPARAELMYRPTTQSNTASGRMSFLERK